LVWLENKGQVKGTHTNHNKHILGTYIGAYV